MSRVIKAALWQEEPRVVKAPPKAVPKTEKREDTAAGSEIMSEEAHKFLLAEIMDKQNRADEMLRQAQTTSEVMIQSAKKKQDEMFAEAESRIASAREEARQAGKEEGYNEGYQEGLAKVQEEQRQTILAANEKAEATIKAAQQEAQAYVQQAEQQIVDLAMKVAEKIIPQHFIDVPQVVLPLVRKCLLKIKDQNEVIVHVHPDAYEMVLLAKGEFQSMLEGNARLEVQSDESLKPGDCVLESPNGNVDAKLETQLQLVKNAIQEVMP